MNKSLPSQEFLDTVAAIATRLGHTAIDLQACIHFETGGTYSPTIKNKVSGATGLIQFMPATAKGLGTSIAALEKMSAIEQLQWVDRYFYPYRNKLRLSPGLASLYMAILMPKYITAPDSAVIFTSPSVAYRQNSGLDSTKKGFITKADAAAKVQSIKEKLLNVKV